MAEISPRKRIWGWMMFDWATQPFYTLLLTFIFAPYFGAVVADMYMAEGLSEDVAEAQAQSTWGLGLTIIGLFIAFTAPVLGAIADTRDRRIPWMILFSIFFAGGTYALWWMLPDASNMVSMLFAFGIAMIGAEYMLVFINALLPSLANDDDMGDLSGSGFALGYAGGVVALIIMLLLFADNENGRTLIGIEPMFGLDGSMREGTRSVGPFVAIWFLIFMIPFYLWVKDNKPPNITGGVPDALGRLSQSIKDVVRQPSLFAYLGSSMFYRDALNAIYGFGGLYAATVLDWEITQIGVFGIVAAISAAVFTWVGGKADKRFGPKPVIIANVWLMILVCTIIVGMTRESFYGVALAEGSKLPDIIMYVMGCVIGGGGGALQGASRTMMARHADPDRPTEAFGLYAFSGKATAFLAPALIAYFTWITASTRLGLAPVIGLFIIALILLRWVHPKGQRDS